MASQLSPRQREILELVASGRTSKEIAAELGISRSTVNWHLANTFARLGASSRAEAVALAMQSPPRALLSRPATTSWLPKPGLRLVVVAITIALVGAVLGGAAVAAFRIGVPSVPSATPHAVSTSDPGEAGPARGTVVNTRAHGGAPDERADTATTTPAHSPDPLPLGTLAPVTAPALPTASAPPVLAPIATLLPALPSSLPTPAIPTLP
jgi:DNA-binding CsgD family transcriptional regulator